MKTKLLIMIFFLFFTSKIISNQQTNSPYLTIKIFNQNKHTEYKIIKFFINKGLHINQSAAIAGNLWVESGFNIEAEGDNGASYGIAQWNKSRKKKLLKWIEKKDNTLETQLEFLWWELNHKEKKAFRKLTETTNLITATEMFAKYYERPYTKDYSNRIEKSYELLDKFIKLEQ